MTRLFLLVLCVTLAYSAPSSAGGGYQQGVQRQIECLALNIYFEARGEPEAGRYLVALVTVNRSEDQSFPNDFCSVVWQKRWRNGRWIAQFSWTQDGLSDMPTERAAWEDALRIATLAWELPSIIETKLIYDGYEHVLNAIYYHAAHVMPWWASEYKHLATVGRHLAYSSTRV